MGIQILRLVPYYNTDENRLKLKEEWLNQYSESLKNIFTNFKDIAENEYSPLERHNLFYTLNHTGKKKRHSFKFAEAVAFDIDKINTSDIDLYVKIVGEATGTSPDKCGVVATGNGLQYIVLLKNKVSDFEEFKALKKHYKYWCERISDSLYESGLVGDVDTSVYDHGRVLRIPFSENIKPMHLANRYLVDKYGTEEEKTEVLNIKSATLLNGNLENEGFELKTAASEEWQDKKKQRKDDYGKPDKEFILSQCEFLKFATTNHAEFDEPLWYATLGVTAFFQDGHETSHELSKNHPGYNYESTQSKSEQASTNSGPRTCENINDLWGGCATCPHYGKCTTPLQLKREDFIATEDNGFTSVRNGKTVYEERDLYKYLAREHNLRYIGEIGRFMVYEDGYFKGVHKEWPKSYAEKMFFPKPDKDTTRMSFLNLCKAASDTPISFVTDHTQKSGLINLENGILKVETGELLPHDPKWGFTYKLPYPYKSDESCPTWDRFMDNFTLGRQHLIDCIEEYIGYILSGMEYKYNTALILSGKGSNGKSTLINFIQSLVGEDNCASVTIKDIESDKFLAAGLEGKLVNISEEEDPQSFRDTGAFKKITGNGTIQVRQLYERGYDMRNRAKLIITYNKLPYLGDTSKGMLRRLMVMPCDLNTDTMPERVIRDIDIKLKAERMGVLNKCVKAFQRLQERGKFKYPKETNRIVDGMVRASDPVADWLFDFVKITKFEGDEVTLQECYKSFLGMQDGRSQMKSRSFRDKVVERISSIQDVEYIVAKNGSSTIRKFRGLRLLDDDSELIGANSDY